MFLTKTLCVGLVYFNNYQIYNVLPTTFSYSGLCHRDACPPHMWC